MTIAVDLGRKATKQTNKHRLLRPTEPGNGRGFDFLATGPWYDHVLTAHLPGLCMATNDWCTKFLSSLCTSHL